MGYEHVEVTWHDWYATVWMDRPGRRNALSHAHMRELVDAFAEVGASGVRGVVLAGRGPVFSAGHDFADVADHDLASVRALLATCVDLVGAIRATPQPVVARVHGLATAAGAQLVATCDLAVAATSASFAAPGGAGGWFCHTPMVAIARNVGRKRAVEMAFTGEAVDAATAAAWGLVNRVVPDDELDDAVVDLLDRASRGSRTSKAVGKQALYHQMDQGEHDAYAYAAEVMAMTSQTPEAREGIASFLERRAPQWPDA